MRYSLTHKLYLVTRTDDTVARFHDENVGHVISTAVPGQARLAAMDIQSDSVKFKVAGKRNGRNVTVKVCAAIPFGGYTVRS